MCVRENERGCLCVFFDYGNDQSESERLKKREESIHSCCLLSVIVWLNFVAIHFQSHLKPNSFYGTSSISVKNFFIKFLNAKMIKKFK